MSLAGRTVLVTRPAAQSAGIEALLTTAGAKTVRFPLVDIEPEAEALTGLPAEAARADWIILISPSAIDCAWPTLAGCEALPRLACVGGASARKLGMLSGRAILHPQTGQDSAALLDMPEMQAVAGRRILIVRGDGGRPELGEALRARGADVRYAEIYRRVETEPDWSLFDELAKQGLPDACIVTSSEIAERFFRLAGSARVRALQCLQYCVPHPRIADKLAALGAARIVTTRADDAAMVAGLKEWYSRHP
jgi:uroporphyrinogen-III synthase